MWHFLAHLQRYNNEEVTGYCTHQDCKCRIFKEELNEM